MNTKSLIILIVLAAVGIAGYLFSTTNSSINSADSIGASIMPGLFEGINEVSQIQIVGAGDQVITSLERGDNQWLVKDRGGYPADIAKIRNTVLALAEAKIIEQKTSKPELYAKLGVTSVESKDASGIKIMITHGAEQQALIVGNPGPQINKNRYVRRADEATSWLIDRKLDLNHDVAYWLQKDILSLEPEDMQAITIELQDGANLEIERVEDDEVKFEVTNLSDPDSVVIDAEIHQVTNALSSMQLLDVVEKDKFVGGEAVYIATYLLNSGVSIVIRAYEIDKDHFMTFVPKVHGDSPSDEDQKYVSDLQKITNDWAFKIPNVTYDSINKREADVLAITEDELN